MTIKGIGTKEIIEVLQRAIDSSKSKTRYYEDELYNIRKNCPHENVEFSTPYEEGSYENGERINWMERLNTCKECGHSWHQQTDTWGDFDGSGLR